VTRPASGYRVCHDLVAVEAFFAAEGFTIIRPETMPLAEQVALFRGADIIAGFAGSGMFNAMFVDAPRLLLISGSSYTANNEYLIGAVVGGSLDVFWGDSDITQPEDGWTWDAFFSPFSFDVAQHAAELRHVING
jgi:capsular polysaccharide biosynthesis protein